jgi:hypothetical protein
MEANTLRVERGRHVAPVKALPHLLDQIAGMNHDQLELADSSHQHGEESGLGAEEGACFNVAALGAEIAGRERPSSSLRDERARNRVRLRTGACQERLQPNLAVSRRRITPQL